MWQMNRICIQLLRLDIDLSPLPSQHSKDYISALLLPMFSCSCPCILSAQFPFAGHLTVAPACVKRFNDHPMYYYHANSCRVLINPCDPVTPSLQSREHHVVHLDDAGTETRCDWIPRAPGCMELRLPSDCVRAVRGAAQILALSP